MRDRGKTEETEGKTEEHIPSEILRHTKTD